MLDIFATSGVFQPPPFSVYNYTLYTPNCQVFFQLKYTFFAKFCDFSAKIRPKNAYFFLSKAGNSAGITDKSRAATPNSKQQGL